MRSDYEAVFEEMLPHGLVRNNGPESYRQGDDDWDVDGLSNRVEMTSQPATDPRAISQADADGDLLDDVWELLWGLNASSQDENGNGIRDELDDFDNDGLTNYQEMLSGSNPMLADTDDDGVTDGVELSQGRDPVHYNPPPPGEDPGDGEEPPAPVSFSLQSVWKQAKVNNYEYSNFRDENGIPYPDDTYEGEVYMLFRRWSIDALGDAYRYAETYEIGSGICDPLPEVESIPFQDFGADPDVYWPTAPGGVSRKTGWENPDFLDVDTGGYFHYTENLHDEKRYRTRLKSSEPVPEGASLTVIPVVKKTTLTEGPQPVPITPLEPEITVQEPHVFEIPPGGQYSEPKEFPVPTAEELQEVDVSLHPVEIKEISFDGSNYHELRSDDGNVTYSAPHWVDNNGDGKAKTNTSSGEKNYPISFTRNTKIQVGGKFKVAYLPSGQLVKIKASSPQGLQIPETTVTPYADGTIELSLTEASNNLTNSIEFHNADDETAFIINWEISIGSSGWCAIGSTKHTVYITMADPIKTAMGLMRETLFNLGCRNAKGKGSAVQTVVDAIYDDFKDRDVQKVKPSSGTLDGTGMKYWNNPPTAGFLTTDLLSSGDGRCGAWTRIFTDVLRSQGIDAQITAFYAPNPNLQTLGPAILAKYPNYQGQITYLFGNPPQPASLILVKAWNIGNEFAPIDDQGIAAQSNPNPQAYFGDHFVVEYGGKYYDPSYGSDVIASQQEWEDAAVDAFGLMIFANPALPDQAQANPALPQGVTIWMWQPDPKGSAETISQPFNY